MSRGPEASFSSLPCGLLHRKAYDMTPGFIRVTKRGGNRESTGKLEVSFL